MWGSLRLEKSLCAGFKARAVPSTNFTGWRVSPSAVRPVVGRLREGARGARTMQVRSAAVVRTTLAHAPRREGRRTSDELVAGTQPGAAGARGRAGAGGGAPRERTAELHARGPCRRGGEGGARARALGAP